MSQRIALVTGASRGIGAAVALELARRGCNLAINYREKAARANEVAQQAESLGRRCAVLQADLSEGAQIERLVGSVRAIYGKLDHLVLNAAGGLERDRDHDYAYRLNVSANRRLVDLFLPIMPRGASIVFVTSHPSHYYGRLPVMAGYERVAATKHAAEEMLLERTQELTDAGVRLAIVSGDLIEGTVNARLMQREYPGLLAKRAEETGPLPTILEFAMAIANAAENGELGQGAVILIGSTSWDTYSALSAAEQGREDAKSDPPDAKRAHS